MDPTLPTLDFRDFCFLAPEIVLAAWGLLVLMVDLGLARRQSRRERRTVDRLAGACWGSAWHLLAVGLLAVQLIGRVDRRHSGSSVELQR